MLIKLRKLIPHILLLVICTEPVLAQSNKENPITTAVPFLRLASDARMGGMGDVGIATNPDANSIFINGGKTVFNESKYGIGLNYTPWLSELDLKNTKMLSFSGFYKLNEKEAISLGVRNFNYGSFIFTDNTGQEIKNFKPNDIAIEVGYSRKLTEKLGLGLSVRYIGSKIGDNSVNSNYKSGKAVAADLSLFHKGTKGLNYGVALTNLGSKLNYGGKANFIPANLGLGVAYNKDLNKDSKVTLAFDLNKLLVPTPPDPTDAAKVDAYENKGVVGSWFSSFGDAPGGSSEEIKEFQLGVGAEYEYKEIVNFRIGYFTENKLKGDRNYFTFGAGLKYNVAGLNFSYLVPTGQNSNMNALSNTIRISLLFDFNNNKLSK